MAEQMTPEAAAALRAPFPPEQIGKLPKPYKADAPKGNCGECGKYHGLPAAHVDYAGHAAVTNRLLTVDPEWTWEPVATDPQTGAPLMVSGGLWIRLTVCGVTRLGYGDGKSVKECIGDAIRNAAMRFGVGLDLWAKESLVEGEHDDPSPGVARPDPAAAESRGLRQQIAEFATNHGWDVSVLGQEFTQTYGVSTSTAKPDELRDFLARLESRVAEQAAAMLGASSEAAAVKQATGTPRPDESGTPRTGDPHGTFGTNRGAVMEEPAPPHPDEATTKAAPAKTPDQWRDDLLAATTKAEVKRILRDIGMARMADTEVGDEQGEMVSLSTLATRRMREVPA